MESSKINIIYEDDNVLVADKPAGVIVFSEEENGNIGPTLIDSLTEKFPTLKNVGKIPRYGIVHRLDKDTSGVLLVAKNDSTLGFLQKEFQERRVVKKYTALTVGNIKQASGRIETLIGRSPGNRQKQKTYVVGEPGYQGKREAISEYKILKRFKNYTLLEITPKTGRKHQIRTHLSHLGYPITCDKLYGFKNQPYPKGLTRQFLHASYLKIMLPDGREKEFRSELPEDLEKITKTLSPQDQE
jgi:23S rRNA pseudouridine1911/1915/1917 synthase